MSINNLWELKYVLLTILMVICLVTGSFVEKHNYLDAIYLIFLLSCFIRYIVICITDRDY